jgi:primase-polymerase (primpol)-like protein
MDSEFAAFDIDNCRNPETGEIHNWARALVEKVRSYTEVTVSGSGLRIIGRASGPKVHRKLPVMDGVSCELYRGAERYIVMTGNALGENELGNIDDAIDATLAELDPKMPEGATAENKGPRSLADGQRWPRRTGSQHP